MIFVALRFLYHARQTVYSIVIRNLYKLLSYYKFYVEFLHMQCDSVYTMYIIWR